MRAKKASKTKKKARRRSREEQLLEAETLGMEELGWIHGGGEACGHCCIWGNPTKCSKPGTSCVPTPKP
jgi:hypothetical protein